MYAEQMDTPQPMTEAEYLAFSDEQELRYEYSGSHVHAMVGGTVRHGTITANMIIQLGSQLADKDCTVTSSDVRVHIAAKNTYRYPNVTVFCGDVAYREGRNDTLTNPAVLVEVLSPSTTVVDRSDKLAEYIRIDSLQSYLLVSQTEPRIEQFSRYDAGQWLYQYAEGLDAEITIPSLAVTLALSKVYNKVNWDEPEPPQEAETNDAE